MDNLTPIALRDNETLYALVDCALVDHLFTQFAEARDLKWQSLFANTENEQHSHLGPVLIQLDSENPTWIAHLSDLQKQQPNPVIWLCAPFAFIPLFTLLRELLHAQKEDGSTVFCRYYDTDCFPLFLSIFNQNIRYAKRMKSLRWAIWQQTAQTYLRLDHHYRHSEE